MFYLITKTLISAIIIVAISEISKHSSFWGAILAAFPLTSMLAMLWLYVETQDVKVVMQLSNSIFWLILPSFALFISLPIFIQLKFNFYLAFSISIFITMIVYFTMTVILTKLGIQL